jgi:hypothetical protein
MPNAITIILPRQSKTRPVLSRRRTSPSRRRGFTSLCSDAASEGFRRAEAVTGKLPTSALRMLGMGVYGNLTADSLQFDSLLFQTTPELILQKQGNDVVLSWPAGFAGYSLQSKSELTQAGSWAPVNTPTFSSSGVNSVTVPITARQQYFRLRR